MPGVILFGIDVESASEDSAGFARRGEALFREMGVPVTWYLTGKTLERYPDIFRGMEENDSIELQAHTYGHVLLKTVVMRVPEGKRIHGSTDWHMKRGAALDDIEADLARCQQVFQDILGRRASALTGPWGYYRGLADRPDILEIVRGHGFRALRTFARNEWDAQPVPLDWQPFFYEIQGFPDVLECMVHDYQDDFYWEAFTGPRAGETYADHLKSVAREVAKRNLTWSLCSHDHRCATEEGFEKKAGWFREIAEFALGLDIRFLSASQYYEETLSRKGGNRCTS